MPKYCMWVQDVDGYYNTECDNTFTFSAGGPGEDGFIFCPYCGGRLVKAYGANGFEPDSAMQYGNDMVLAQHEETGRVWKGYRSSVPPRHFIIRGEMEPPASPQRTVITGLGIGQARTGDTEMQTDSHENSAHSPQVRVDCGVGLRKERQ